LQLFAVSICILSEGKTLIYVMLQNLDPNKSAGPDNWPTKVLKDMAEQLCLPLTILFTKSIQTSTLPDAWKRDPKGDH